MFDERSRYGGLPTRIYDMPDGRSVSYVVRRIVPPANSYVKAGSASITDSDRIDLVAYRHLGHSAGFWQVADANDAMHPVTLTMEPGQRLVIPLPRAKGS